MITAKDLSYSYGEKPVLKGIQLNVEEGWFVALAGANGSGKTTLLKHLNGLLLSNSGKVLVDGMDTRKNSLEVRKRVGFVFQNPEEQLVNSIVEEDIAFGLENLGLPTEEIRKKVKEVLEKLCIEELAKENVNCLSFGQKQLVALAGVIAMEPKYIVFDEPTAMLDARNKSKILAIMKKLNKEGKTIVTATNNLNDIKKYAKRVIVLNQGKVAFNGKIEKLSRRILKESGLDES